MKIPRGIMALKPLSWVAITFFVIGLVFNVAGLVMGNSLLMNINFVFLLLGFVCLAIEEYKMRQAWKRGRKYYEDV